MSNIIFPPNFAQAQAKQEAEKRFEKERVAAESLLDSLNSAASGVGAAGIHPIAAQKLQEAIWWQGSYVAELTKSNEEQTTK